MLSPFFLLQVKSNFLLRIVSSRSPSVQNAHHLTSQDPGKHYQHPCSSPVLLLSCVLPLISALDPFRLFHGYVHSVPTALSSTQFHIIPPHSWKSLVSDSLLLYPMASTVGGFNPCEQPFQYLSIQFLDLCSLLASPTQNSSVNLAIIFTKTFKKAAHLHYF